ncbi:hypothetical protein ACFWFU_26055 [Streptomyces sp. NPDC060235]|uniref:hypothetical protein n=1 Tax=Streptomyces sp. NPDC060235 TaxID=3347080 RepID=UPI003664C53E
MTTGGKTYFYLTDALGSVVAQSTEPVAQPYRFAGNYQDLTGLYHLQARYYDANISGAYHL